MPMLEKYRHYFNIDPDYFPAVNEAVITKNPEVWKKFFPHETFVKLLKNTVSVLERKQKLCLWVEGAYGTGKSHAVHTLKKLLDSSEEETREYFQRHKMDNDLYNRFQAVKSSGRILTVHRYGSASIRSDHNLVFAIQESIEKALVDAGIENKGGNALKDATIAWLSDKDNKNYFNGLITGTYSDLFGGDDADTVIEKLRTFSGEALARIMDNIFKVADERQVKALSLSVTDLGNWIREVIRANSLKAIVFMWDEFTEYFYNNARNLTGFQELCEISETDPFYFVLVTHVTQGLFHERDQDFIKLNGRFVSPHSLISLPENIAFQLMGAAMEKNKDEVVLADWEVALGDLTDRTQASRKLVKSVARITDKEMIDILPIHPYAALLLKHISSAFDSNQRSMFDFIKNDRGDEIKGFQWFIDNFGPEDDNPLLSVDMLWEFFYDKGKEYLSHDIRSILDYYNRAGNQRLDSDQKRVLKTVLLLQAISQYAGDSVELFIPNEKNLDNAFEGTDMEGSAARCADQLVREKVLFSKSLGGGKFQYAAYNHENEIDVTPFEEQIDRKSTSAFITEELADRTRIVDAISLGGALKLRYELRYVSSSDFDSTIKQLRNTEEKYANKIVAVVCFAKDDAESVVLGKKIHDALAAGTYNMIFIDASRTPFGADGYGVYRHDMALSMSQQGKDPALVTQYANNAKDSLKKWKTRIAGGEFMVHTADKPDGERATTLDALYGLLAEINKKKFVSCLEGSYNVIANMYILTFQCVEYLHTLIKNDRRLDSRICVLEGIPSARPKLIFTAEGIQPTDASALVKGLRGMAKAVESAAAEILYIETAKSKDQYPFSLYTISDLKNPYEVLCHLDAMTSVLPESYGDEENWQYALTEFRKYSSWQQLISAQIGSVNNLDIVISTYKQKASNKKWLWLYFIGLKLFHAGNNSYFNKAIETATSPSGLIHSLYRTILEEDPTDKDFISQYRQRKDLLNSIENPLDEVSGFCKIVQSKGKYALCYLTDNTLQEKELIFKLLDRYSEDFGRAELLDILERIYPDLRAYLTAYHFKSELLDNYFQEYKYQKVVNKIFPDFMTLVEKQAVDRDYNRILPPRSSVIEGIDVTDTQTYFTDAMGVEYLGYIMSRCHALKLMAKVTVCRCELPSITSRNKEFWDVLSTDRFPIISVDKIDKIKHHGEEGYDYSREDRKLPIHLIRELELIDELLKKIKTNLTNGDYQKAILIADHGASRLAVIHGTENLWEMQSSGKHSGRCCPKSEVDERPDSATDAEDFWALANYDRFKGSRKANVEVHGGATLEEVTVPIIEISYLNDAVEVKIMPIDSTATFTGIPEIFVSFRKKAAIKVFSTEKLVDVSVVIDGHTYEAKPTADNFYVVEEMTEIRRAKTYSVDVFAGGMPVATGLPLRVKKESGSEKNIL